MISIPENIAPYLEIEDCSSFPMSRYYATKDMDDILNDIVRMQRTAEKLQKMGISYLNSTILYGVPGTGKTTAARYIAYKLGKPLAKINFAQLLGGEFGTTAKNISAIFRFIADVDCIFLMDEIDCVGVKRGTESAVTGGELARVTITIMQELDYYRDHKLKAILMSATNRIDILDEALVSRFSIQHQLKPLTNEDTENYVKKFLDDVKVPYDEYNIEDYAGENSALTQRNVEADMVRCIAEWVDKGGDFVLNHIG